MDTVARATDRTTLRRLPGRGSHDRALIDAILDEGIVCHLAFVAENTPYAIPTTYARAGDEIYVHGSAASRMMRSLAGGADVCLTVTLIDGYVLARSAFHHSMNYRSVVVLGHARLVTDPQEKFDALRSLVDHIVPDRWLEVRRPTQQELKATTVLALPIVEASAKVRTGPPVDDEEDHGWPVWAGVVPLRSVVGQPVADERVLANVPVFDPARFGRR